MLRHFVFDLPPPPRLDRKMRKKTFRKSLKTKDFKESADSENDHVFIKAIKSFPLELFSPNRPINTGDKETMLKALQLRKKGKVM